MKLAAALATALAICSGQSADAATLTWTGSSGASSNVWDVGITPNWLSGGVPAVFNNGDAVVFDDTGTNIPTVKLTTTVVPSSVTVNSAGTYNFTNSGGSGIGGSGKLIKLGGSTLNLWSANTYSGGTTGGGIRMNNANALGTGVVTLDRYNLTFGLGLAADNGGLGVTNEIAIAATAVNVNTYSFANRLSGKVSGGILNGNGLSPGSLTLSGDNSDWSGGFNFIGSITLSLGHLNALGRGTMAMTPGLLPVVSAATDLSAGLGVTNAIVMNGNPLTFNLTNNLLLSGPISGGSNFVKSGSATLILSGSNTFTGNLTNTAGTLKLGSSKALGSGTLVMKGGKLGTVAAVALTNKLTLATDGEIANTNDLTWSGVISGPAALIKSGSGTLTLSGANGYSGGTTVSNGTLNVANLTGSGTGSGLVTAQSGGSLGGTGIITGPVTVNSGGTLSPGDTGIGQLRISNALTLAAGSTTAMELNKSTGTNAAVMGLTSVSYGGTLTITNLGGALAAGDSFKLFDAASYSGSFAAIVPAVPGDGLLWDTSTLASDGTLRVVTACGVSILSQPVGRAAVAGSTVSFSVMAHTTTGVTNYQWQFTGSPIPGTTNKLFVLNSVQATNFGAYAVVVGNGLCSIPSQTAQLTQAVRPSFFPSRLNGTTITMSFPTEFGPTYAVEYKETLADADWNLLNTLNGTGNTEMVTDTTANSVTRFYRIRVQ